MKYYLPPLLTCIFFIWLSHILLIRYFPRKKRFWKKVDYLWISFGIIGLIGASFSFRKEYSTIQQPWHKRSLFINYNLYLDYLSDQSNHFLDSNGFDYDRFDDQNKVRSFTSAGEFFQHQFEKAKEYREQIFDDEQFSFIDSIVIPFRNFYHSAANEYVRQTVAMADYMIKSMEKEKEILEDLRNSADRNFFDWFLLMVSPYLLATAIAIRLTKVTAELKDL